MDRLLDETESTASSRAATPLPAASSSSTSQSGREETSSHNGLNSHSSSADATQTLSSMNEVKSEPLQTNGASNHSLLTDHLDSKGSKSYKHQQHRQKWLIEAPTGLPGS